jgi:hypothetical protein
VVVGIGIVAERGKPAIVNKIDVGAYFVAVIRRPTAAI